MRNEPADDQRRQNQQTSPGLLTLINDGLASGEARPITNQLIEGLRARSFNDE
jgi:hypothetical protein